MVSETSGLSPPRRISDYDLSQPLEFMAFALMGAAAGFQAGKGLDHILGMGEVLQDWGLLAGTVAGIDVRCRASTLVYRAANHYKEWKNKSDISNGEFPRYEF